ncbi:MAG TPA: hypothetical protein VIK27_05275 [Candidatus Aquilonibacter sp.]
MASALLCAAVAAAPQRDGAVIVNTGSTNTAGYTITIWSDGSALAQIQGGAGRPFTVSQALADRFFIDLKAARANGKQRQHCMKSTSFGTRTIVRWHGWVSPDFQCPPFTTPVAALAQDTSAIESAANIQAGPHLRRIRLPDEMRKIPTPTPEVTPT